MRLPYACIFVPGTYFIIIDVIRTHSLRYYILLNRAVGCRRFVGSQKLFIRAIQEPERLLKIPGHALHEKSLQRQKGVFPLVGSQKRKSASRPAVTPVINRGSTAGFVPSSVYKGFPLFVLPEAHPGCYSSTCRTQNPYIPQTGRGRRARRSGRAGSGKIRCQQNYSPKKRKSTVPSKASKKHRSNVSPEARTSEILCKPTEGQNHRLTRG